MEMTITNGFDYLCRHFHPLDRKIWKVKKMFIKVANHPLKMSKDRVFYFKLENFSFLNQTLDLKKLS